jgi:hypothetical protein
MSEHEDPAQRCHWYAYDVGGEPLHLPFDAVSVWPSIGVPDGVGCSVGAGADPALAMTPLAAEVSCAEPSAFVAVTRERMCGRRRPT